MNENIIPFQPSLKLNNQDIDGELAIEGRIDGTFIMFRQFVKVLIFFEHFKIEIGKDLLLLL